MASRINNLGDLRRQILSTLWRDQDDPDFLPEVEGWINLAEQKISAELRVRQMIVHACEQIRERYLVLPSDWLEAIHFRIPNIGALLPMEMEDTAQYYYGNKGAYPPGYVAPPLLMLPGGVPQRYAIVADRIEIIPDPTPALTQQPGNFYHLEMVYYARPKALRADTDTNPVLLDFPVLYLYGSLVYAAPHIDHDERLQTWGTLYADALNAANLAWERASRSGGRINARIRAA
jgi:hypothetical protein